MKVLEIGETKETIKSFGFHIKSTLKRSTYMVSVIPPMKDYYLDDDGFYLKSKTTKSIKIGLMIGLVLGSLIATKTTASIPPIPEGSWIYTKTKYTEYIQKANREVSDREAHQIISSIFKWSAEYKINPELMFAVAKVESRFDKHAISTAGAMGVMQVLTKVHLDKIVEARNELGNPEIFNIDTNIFLGAKVLRGCLDKFNLTKNALLCYNGSNAKPNGYDVKVMNEYNNLRTMKI